MSSENLNIRKVSPEIQKVLNVSSNRRESSKFSLLLCRPKLSSKSKKEIFNKKNILKLFTLGQTITTSSSVFQQPGKLFTLFKGGHILHILNLMKRNQPGDKQEAKRYRSR